MTKTITPALLLWLLLTAPAHAADNWSALSGEGSTAPTCQLTSPHLEMDDGQGNTSIWLEMTPTLLLVKTKSTIDTEFKDIGLKVDDKAFIAFDEIRNDTDVAYTKAMDTLIQQFIEGQKVTVMLRFWPTWPTTGQKSIEFSLLGFTKAWQSGACPMPASVASTATQEPTKNKDESGEKQP